MKFSLRFKSGFSALEGLIVLAFFGLVLTLGAFSLRSARARTRDAVRVSDVQMLRAGLHIHWQQKGTYPLGQNVVLGTTGTSDALTLNGFVASQGAEPPLVLERLPVGPSSKEHYVYTGVPNGFSIRFQTERETFLGPPNVYYVHSTGFDTSEEPR